MNSVHAKLLKYTLTLSKLVPAQTNETKTRMLSNLAKLLTKLDNIPPKPFSVWNQTKDLKIMMLTKWPLSHSAFHPPLAAIECFEWMLLNHLNKPNPGMMNSDSTWNALHVRNLFSNRWDLNPGRPSYLIIGKKSSAQISYSVKIVTQHNQPSYA